jgi:hypothetical protein
MATEIFWMSTKFGRKKSLILIPKNIQKYQRILAPKTTQSMEKLRLQRPKKTAKNQHKYRKFRSQNPKNYQKSA